MLQRFPVRHFLFLILPVLAATSGLASTTTITPSEASTQVQASINNSHAGDTIFFQQGTYNLGNLRLLEGRTYLGATDGQTILHGTGGSPLMTFHGSGMTLQHFTFDGGGLYLSGPVSNVNLEYNLFENISFGPTKATEWGNWPSTNAIFIDTSIATSDISYNSFQNLNTLILDQYADHGLGVTAIFGYNVHTTTITYNTFDTVNEGIHFFATEDTQVLYNTLVHFHRIGMEFQDNSKNLEVGFNSFSEPMVPFWTTFGISAAITGGNASIHDNLIDDQVEKGCADGCWIGYGVEAWGVGTVVTHNTIQGHWGNGVAIGPSRNLSVLENKICGADLGVPGADFVGNQNNTKWAGEVIAPNATANTPTCQ